MSTTSAYIFLSVFTFMFLGLSVLFGTTQPGFQNAINAPDQCLFNNNPAPTCSFPTWNPPRPNNITTTVNQVPWWQCLLSVPCVVQSVAGSTGVSSTAQQVWNGLSIIGYAIGLIPVYTFVFFNKLYNSLLLVNTMISLINTDYGVPFLSYFFFAFTFIWLFIGVAIFKPGGHGG